MAPIRWCIHSRVYIYESSRSTVEFVIKLFARRVLVKHLSIDAASRRRRRSDKMRDRGITRYRFLLGIRRIAKKLCVENTRGVIFEMETCSLVCADIKETFLSRKNNMHRARCLLCARVSLICMFRITFSLIVTNMYRLFLQKKIRAAFEPRTKTIPIPRLLLASSRVI